MRAAVGDRPHREDVRLAGHRSWGAPRADLDEALEAAEQEAERPPGSVRAAEAGP